MATKQSDKTSFFIIFIFSYLISVSPGQNLDLRLWRDFVNCKQNPKIPEKSFAAEMFLALKKSAKR
jgi:hypothetical protein